MDRQTEEVESRDTGKFGEREKKEEKVRGQSKGKEKEDKIERD